MTKIVSFYGRGFFPKNYEDIKIEPQQITEPTSLWFLDNVKISDFPEDYIEFISYFGEGLLGDCVRIFPINFIDNLLLPWREQTSKNKFFNDCSVISHEQLSKSLIIGDGVDNEQFIYYDGNYFIYNVEIKEFVVNVGDNIKNIFEWYATGQFYDPIVIDTFVPFKSSNVSDLNRIIGRFFYDFERKY